MSWGKNPWVWCYRTHAGKESPLWGKHCFLCGVHIVTTQLGSGEQPGINVVLDSCPAPFKRKWVLSNLWRTEAHCFIIDIPPKKQNPKQTASFCCSLHTTQVRFQLCEWWEEEKGFRAIPISGRGPQGEHWTLKGWSVSTAESSYSLQLRLQAMFVVAAVAMVLVYACMCVCVRTQGCIYARQALVPSVWPFLWVCLYVVCVHVSVSSYVRGGCAMSVHAFRGLWLHHSPLYSLRHGLSVERRAHDMASFAS